MLLYSVGPMCSGWMATPFGSSNGLVSFVRALSIGAAQLTMPSKRPIAEMFLYQAARAQLVAAVIRPALDHGSVVVCERWHYATSAYQGVGGGAGLEAVELSSRLATGSLDPDRAVLLDAPQAVLDTRIDRPLDRVESRGAGFRDQVAQAYRDLFRRDPRRLRIVSAEGTPDDVAPRVWEAVSDLF